MKLKLFSILLAVLLLALAATVVSANGPSPVQLERAGWTCGPDGGLPPGHCTPPGAGASSASIPVKVFHMEEGNWVFLGTELLIRGDLAGGNGQPCPQDLSFDLTFPDGTVYYACHHYPEFTGS